MSREQPLCVLLASLGSIAVGGLCIFAGMATLGRELVALVIPSEPFARQAFFPRGVYAHSLPLPDLQTYLAQEVPGYPLVELLMPLAMLAGGVLLLIAGIGLLHMRPWARWLAVGYTVAMLAVQLGYALFQLGMVWPVIEIYYLDDYGMFGSSIEAIWTGFLLFLFIQVGLLVAHAVGLLVVLALPSVGAAFRGAASDRCEPVV